MSSTVKGFLVLAAIGGVAIWLSRDRRREIRFDVGYGFGAGQGAAGAPSPQEDSHQRMIELIEESEQAIRRYDNDQAVDAQAVN